MPSSPLRRIGGAWALLRQLRKRLVKTTSGATLWPCRIQVSWGRKPVPRAMPTASPSSREHAITLLRTASLRLRAMAVRIRSRQGEFSIRPSPDRDSKCVGMEANSASRRLDRPQRVPRETSSRIAFVYGSGAKRRGAISPGTTIGSWNSPMDWIDPLQQWGASLFDRHASGDFSRDMTLRCVECHNTWFEHVPGTRNQYGHEKFHSRRHLRGVPTVRGASLRRLSP